MKTKHILLELAETDLSKRDLQWHSDTSYVLKNCLQTHAALTVWFEKTHWVQQSCAPHELGMHRADVLKSRIEKLQKENALLKQMLGI